MVEKIKLAIIDNEEGIHAAAVDSAEAQLTADKQELKGVSGFFKKMWRHNLAREYYRQTEIGKTKEKIAASGNIYIDEEGTSADHDEAMSAIIDRFTSDFDGVVEKEAGERKNILGEKSVADESPEERPKTEEGLVKENQLKEKIINLVKEYASGKINEEEFKKQKMLLFSNFSSKKNSDKEENGRYADNLLEMAKQIRQNIDHGQRMDLEELEFEVIVGKAKAGVRTEANYNRIDKIAEKITSSRLGFLVNETTVATGLGIAYSIGAGVSQKIASSKLLAWGTLGASTLLAGGIAGAKENRRLKEERRLHNRQMAQGKKFESDKERRTQMEEFRYQTESAQSLTNNLFSSLYDEKTELKAISQPDLDKSLLIISEIDARNQLSGSHKIDLIHFSSTTAVEKERRDLLFANAKAKCDLKELLSKRTDLVFPNNTSLDEYIKKLTDTKIKNFLTDKEGIEAKDKTFNKMKAKEVAWTSVKSAGIGLAVGTFFQEIAASFNADRQGLVERLFDGKSEGKSTTMVEGIRRWLVGGDSPRLGGPLHEQVINNGKFNSPVEASLKVQPDGSYALTRPGNETFVENLKIEPEGRLTEESKILLGQHNVLFDEHRNTIATGNSSIEQVITPGQEISQTVPTEEYINKHPELFHEVNRDIWYDNDTKAFDKNELKTWWGGENNTGIDKDGNFVFNVKHMMPKGSYHGSESVDAQELIKNNKLKMVFSLSGETQNMVCEVFVDENGDVIVPKDSEKGKLLFLNENGKAKFLGKLGEVVESLGKDDNGVEKIKMLSTVVGEGLKEVTSLEAGGSDTNPNITSPEVKVEYVTNLDVPGDDPIDLPLVIPPILARTPLERMAQKPSPVANKLLLGEGSGRYLSAGPLLLGASSQFLLPGGKQLLLDSKGQFLVPKPEGQYLLKYRSKSLTENPETELDHYKETEEYFKTFSEKNFNEVIELADQVEPAKESTLSAICMPVNCEGGFKHLYSSLENYTKQTADNNTFEINLLLYASDVSEKQNSEIFKGFIKEDDKFKKNFPLITVNVMSKIFPVETLTSGRIRKQLTDATLYRHHTRGATAPDLILISNNAENLGVDPEYVQNFISKFDTNKKVDALVGELDWDPEDYIKQPALHVGTRLFQYLSKDGNEPDKMILNPAANFSFRSSIYSAVGGYIPELNSGEDLTLGQEIAAGRGNRSAVQHGGGKVSRIFTSGKSVIDSMEETFSFDEDEKVEETIDFNDKRQLNQLKKTLEHIINKTLEIFERKKMVGKDNEYYQHPLNRLGIEYALNKKGKLIITNMSRLVSALKKYQNIGIPLRDYNSGKISKEALEKIIKSNKKDKTVIEL